MQDVFCCQIGGGKRTCSAGIKGKSKTGIISGAVVFCSEWQGGQKAACSSSGEWIHYNEGVLYADTHHSLTGYNWQAGKIEETTLEEKTDQYDSEFSKNIFWNFQVADSVIFLDNTDKNRSRISSGTYEDETVFQKKILSGGSSYMTCLLYTSPSPRD